MRKGGGNLADLLGLGVRIPRLQELVCILYIFDDIYPIEGLLSKSLED